MSKRKGKESIFLGKMQNRGELKLAVLLALAAVVLFLIITMDVQRTTAQTCDCTVCHGPAYHGAGWQGCGTCHGFPPATGSHVKHFEDPEGLLGTYQPYGFTSIAKDYYPDPDTPASSYLMGCGNCHPLDNAKHQNGVVDMELYNAAAPADSLKAKNPLTAGYTPGSTTTTYSHGSYSYSYSDGTCTDIYCHSGYTVTSGPVGNPLTYPANPIPPGFKLNTLNNGVSGFIMDETCSSLTYAPYTVNSQRAYKTTAAWGTAPSPSTCTECHEFPLTTWGPDVQAGVGDSHQWYNDLEGWNYGHANNMDYFPGIPCATCHYGTADHRNGVFPPYPLDSSNTPTYWTDGNRPTYWTTVNGLWIKGYYPVPLKNRALHINGTPDVTFDTVNGYRYYYYCAPGSYGCWTIDEQKDLNSAQYDQSTKTCSDVACHYKPTSHWQKKVKWGSPYRGWYGPGEECDQCHRMGYLREVCQ